MSYIHQALKKAQTERDDRYGRYRSILPSRSKRPNAARRWVLFGIAGVLILSLAFVAYSWLDSEDLQHVEEAPPKPSPPPASAPKHRVDAEALYRVAKNHHKNGRLKPARVFYEKALRADPGNVTALNNLGVILMTEGDYSGARSKFEKAIRLNPGYVDPCYNLACLFAVTDQPRQGLNYLKRAVSLDPRVKAWALKDTDLEKLHNQPEFEEIVG